MTPLVDTWSSLLASLSRPCTIEVVHRLFDVQYSPFFLLGSVLNKNPLAVVSLLVDSNVCDCFCKPLLGTFRDHVYATHPTLQCWFVFLPISFLISFPKQVWLCCLTKQIHYFHYYCICFPVWFSSCWKQYLKAVWAFFHTRKRQKWCSEEYSLYPISA